MFLSQRTTWCPRDLYVVRRESWWLIKLIKSSIYTFLKSIDAATRHFLLRACYIHLCKTWKYNRRLSLYRETSSTNTELLNLKDSNTRKHVLEIVVASGNTSATAQSHETYVLINSVHREAQIWANKYNYLKAMTMFQVEAIFSHFYVFILLVLYQRVLQNVCTDI